jgi:DMSO/TMAO reductase YedYZ molybdopterin-dependent catalytic subunit
MISKSLTKYLLLLLLAIPAFASYAQHVIPPTSQFVVTGAVKHEFTFHLSDIKKYKQDSLGDVISKNKRGEQKAVLKQLKGIQLKAILDCIETPDKPKEYSELIIVLTATDGYKNVYSWNELFNTEAGNKVYVITEIDGQPASNIPGSILVLSLADFNSGNRHFKGLTKVEVKKI